MPKAETNVTEGAAPKSRLLDSDAPAPTTSAAAPAAEPQFTVGGKEVSREEYMAALPKAGWVPERMPENYFPPLPAVDTK